MYLNSTGPLIPQMSITDFDWYRFLKVLVNWSTVLKVKTVLIGKGNVLWMFVWEAENKFTLGFDTSCLKVTKCYNGDLTEMNYCLENQNNVHPTVLFDSRKSGR